MENSARREQAAGSIREPVRDAGDRELGRSKETKLIAIQLRVHRVEKIRPPSWKKRFLTKLL